MKKNNDQKNKRDEKNPFLEELRKSIDELKKMQTRFQDFLHSERGVIRSLDASIFNCGRKWHIVLKLKPESCVGLSRLVKIGRNTHRWWRFVEEFPSKRVTGHLLYIERYEREEHNAHYSVVLADVTGYQRKGLKIFVNLNHVESVVGLTLGEKIKEHATDFTAFVRTVDQFPSELLFNERTKSVL